MFYQNPVFNGLETKFRAVEQNLYRANQGYVLAPLNYAIGQAGVADMLATAFYNWLNENGIKLDYQQYGGLMAAYAVFYNQLVVGFNRNGESRVFTASTNLLRAMAKQGIVVAKDNSGSVLTEIQLLEDKMCSQSVLKKNLKAGAISLIAVDFYFDKNNIRATVQKAGTNPNFTDWVFTPMTCYVEAWNLLASDADMGVVQITSNNGAKVRYCTRNYELLAKFHGEKRAQELLRYVPDAHTLALYLPVINAPKTTMGSTHVRLEQIDSVIPVDASTVDMSNLNLDLSAFRRYALLKIGDTNLKVADKIAQDLNVKMPKQQKTWDAKSDTEKVLYILSGAKSHELYEWMQQNGFDLRDYSTAFEPHYTYRPVDLMTECPTPHALYELLGNNLLQIVYRTKKGTFRRTLCTNNKQLLKSILGEDYVGRLESKYNIGKELLAHLQGSGTNVQTDLSADDLQKLAGSYYTPDLAQLKEVAQSWTEHDDSVYTSDPNKVTYRNIDSISKSNFYGSVDYTMIESVDIVS